MNLKETCKAIKDIKIQGAENITTAALHALADLTLESTAKSKKEFLKEIESANKQLFNTRPTEPEMRNYCTQVLRFVKEFPEKDILHVKHATKENIKHILIRKQERKERLVKVGSIFLVSERKEKKLKIYTHCHAGSVTEILKKAHKEKQITVINTETRPLFQGRITAKELSKEGIPVIHHLDAAMGSAIQEADLILLGADAITTEGVYNKIGSELVGILGNHYKKPIFICASLWKWDIQKEHIEQRTSKEVWKQTPRGVSIHNPSFEKIHWKHIKAIICEEGVLKPQRFIKNIKQKIKQKTFYT